jgi:hypothetical protein
VLSADEVHGDMLIFAHHLLRCREGVAQLNRKSSGTDHRVICIADQ